MFLALVGGRMGKDVYALEWCDAVVVMRTRWIAAMTRCEMRVETREGKDKMYLAEIVMSEDRGGCIQGYIRGRQCGEGTGP